MAPSCFTFLKLKFDRAQTCTYGDHCSCRQEKFRNWNAASVNPNMVFKKPQTNSSLLKNSFLTADTHVCNFNSFYRSMELKVGIPWVFFYISIYSEIFYQPRYRFQLLLIQHDLTKKQIIFQKNLIVRNQNRYQKSFKIPWCQWKVALHEGPIFSNAIFCS